MDPTKTQVVCASHPRGNTISQEEVEQCIKDLSEWYATHAKSVSAAISKAGHASQAQIEALGQETKAHVPNELIALLKHSNGGFQLHDSYVLLSVAEAIAQNEINAVSAFWKNNYLTVGKDIEENYLLVQCNPDGTSGKVVSWNNDGGVAEELNENLGLYLEGIRNGVLKNDLEFIEGLGLVERAN